MNNTLLVLDKIIEKTQLLLRDEDLNFETDWIPGVTPGEVQDIISRLGKKWIITIEAQFILEPRTAILHKSITIYKPELEYLQLMRNYLDPKDHQIQTKKENSAKQWPLVIGKGGNIEAKDIPTVLVHKSGNKAYAFLVGCITLADSTGKIDADKLFEFLVSQNSTYQARYKIESPGAKNADEKWKLLSETFNNVKRDYINDLGTYLKKGRKGLKEFQWS